MRSGGPGKARAIK